MTAEAGTRFGRYVASQHVSYDTCAYERLAPDWRQHYQLVSTAPFKAVLEQASLGPLYLAHEHVSVPFRFEGCAGRDVRIFCMPLANTVGLRCKGRQMDPGVVAVGRGDSLSQLTCLSDMDAIVVTVEWPVLQAHCERTSGRTLREGEFRELQSLRDPGVTRLFEEQVLGMLRETVANPLIFSDVNARTSLHASVLSVLMEVLEAADGTFQRLPAPSTRAYIVNKALEFIDSHPAETISVATLCETIGTTSRTLRYSFESILGVSPMRYIVARRLDLARRELLRARQDIVIEAVAMRCGFWHMGRFATNYRKAYGERPSDTRARVLASRHEATACNH